MSDLFLRDQDFISRLTEIILANLGREDFGVKELSAEAGLSCYKINKRLLAHTKKTISQFTREIRLNKAFEMLKNNGELTASEIAYKTGFGSPAYFNTCFHEMFGYPPGKVRSELNDIAEERGPKRASQIEGYNYDIFLSYCWKDNNQESWVTEFADHLRSELTSLFMGEITLCYDLVHNEELQVMSTTNDILKEKLKCLLFIPVISQTYCDPVSFPWENEFNAFIEQASDDRFGLKVSLPEGRLACRVLPVRIHELNESDIELCESLLDGPFRSVDFLYEEHGIKRPLTPCDDEKSNLKRTNYRNQINKLAHEINEIISGLKRLTSSRATIKNEVRPQENIPEIKVNSIAVLPFIDTSIGKDQDFFCDGLTEEIINALVHIENFKVIARTSVFAFKNMQMDIREIGRRLNVKHVLEGSSRKDGKRIRITAQLISVEDGVHVWSDNFDRDLKDVFAIQDEIAQAIADTLKIKLGEKKLLISKRQTDNIEAYNLFLKGNYHWQTLTKTGLHKAVEYYEKALMLDPSYSLAYVGMASVNIQNSFHGNSPPHDAYPTANKHLLKALRIDHNLAEAYSMLGTIETFYRWNWKKADLYFKQALHLNPNSAMIHLFYSFYLTCTKRHEEALFEVKRAQALDPLSVYINSHAGIAYTNYNRQYDKAVEEFKLALSLNPGYHFAHLHLANAYFGKSMLKEAGEEWAKAVELSGGLLYEMAYLTSYYYRKGDRHLGDNMLETIKKRAETEYMPPMSFHLIYKYKGDAEMAFNWFRKACINRDSFLLWFLVSPLFSFEDNRYKLHLEKSGLSIKGL